MILDFDELLNTQKKKKMLQIEKWAIQSSCTDSSYVMLLKGLQMNEENIEPCFPFPKSFL